MKRRKRLSRSRANALKQTTFKMLKCKNFKKCGHEEKVDHDCVEVICSSCVAGMVGIDAKLLHPVAKQQKKSADGFPRGWHLYKQFVHPDGRVFELGVENKKLNGTLPPTKVKVNTLTKGQRRRLREEKKLRKEQRLAKRYEKKMKMKEKEND